MGQANSFLMNSGQLNCAFQFVVRQLCSLSQPQLSGEHQTVANFARSPTRKQQAGPLNVCLWSPAGQDHLLSSLLNKQESQTVCAVFYKKEDKKVIKGKVHAWTQCLLE